MQCRTWSMARKLKNMENEKYILQDLDYGEESKKTIHGEKHSKMWKMRNAHGKTWNMVRKLKIMENEKHTLQVMKYGEKHSKT